MQLAAGSERLNRHLLLIIMSIRRFLWRGAFSLCSANLVFAFQQGGTAGTGGPLPPLPQDANQYLTEVVKHQLAANSSDHSHWRSRIHREDDKGTQDRDVIDTKEGQLARTLLINGKPLTQEQRAADEARMKKLVEDPSERAKREKRARDDEDKLTQMFK